MSFDNSLYSNSINEAVSRQNAVSKAEDTLERAKVGIATSKDAIKAIAEGKWGQLGDMIGQGTLDSGLRGHGLQFYTKMIGKKAGASFKNRLMKSKIGKLGQQAIGELDKDEIDEIQKSAEKNGIQAGATTFIKQRLKKGASSFIDKFKGHYDKTFGGDNPELEEGEGTELVRTTPSLSELEDNYSSKTVSENLGIRDLSSYGDGEDLGRPSLHQQAEAQIAELQPQEHIQDTTQIKGQAPQPESEQEVVKDGTADEIKTVSDEDEEDNRYSNNPLVEKEGEAMEKDIDGNNENAEVGGDEGDDPLAGIVPVLGDLAIMGIGTGIMALTNLITGGTEKKEQEEAQADRVEAVKQAQAQALASVPSISTQYGV